MRLSKQDAATRLGVSTATVERRIQRGELEAEKEPHGTRYRVWVLFDDEVIATDVATPVEAPVQSLLQQERPSDATGAATPPVAQIDVHVELARLQEQLEKAQYRASSLEELAGFHRQALTDSEWRYHEILLEFRQCQQNLAAVTRALPAPQEPSNDVRADGSRRWRFWWPFR